MRHLRNDGVRPGVRSGVKTPQRHADLRHGEPRRRALARRRSGRPARDLAGWLALGLVVAGVVVLTARGAGTSVPQSRLTRAEAHALDALDSVDGRHRRRSVSAGTAAGVGATSVGATRAPAPRRDSTGSTDRVSATTTTTATKLPATTGPAATALAPTVPASTWPSTTTTAAAATTTPATAPATTARAPAPATTTATAPPPQRPRATVPVARVPRTTILVPAVASARWPGNFDYPEDVTASYTIRTSGGVVAATAAWSGTPALTIGVACRGSTRSASGDSGLYVAAVAAPGTCAITIGEPPGVEAVVSYSLVVHYPALERQGP